MPNASIKLKRVYEPVEPKDGLRILVERLWPRGVSKEKAKIDYWVKDIAPAQNFASGMLISLSDGQFFAKGILKS
jgi:uncharacterized protein YeaO (DUF488 family)